MSVPDHLAQTRRQIAERLSPEDAEPFYQILRAVEYLRDKYLKLWDHAHRIEEEARQLAFENERLRGHSIYDVAKHMDRDNQRDEELVRLRSALRIIAAPPPEGIGPDGRGLRVIAQIALANPESE